MTSLRAKLVRIVTGLYFSSIDAHKTNVQTMRRKWHAVARNLPVARGVVRKPGVVAGLRAEWLVPEGAPDDTVILYLHGGAYVMGSCSTHRQLVSHIARAAGAKALMPEYRLAPEHPFPAAIDDAVTVYRALLGYGYQPENIVMAGDSAGGGLTMATMLKLRDIGMPLPAQACLLSPWLDLTGNGESMQTHAHRDPWFRPEDLPIITAYYCHESELRNPLVSPVYADVKGLPPLYIQVGEDEILLSDSTRIAAAVKSAGGRAELETWPDMWHVFQAFVHQVPEARVAIRKLGEQMQRAFCRSRVLET